MNKVTKFLAIFIFSVMFLASCSKTEKDAVSSEHFKSEITLDSTTVEGKHYIAIAAPLTGPYQALGKTIVEGAQLALEEFNDLAKDQSEKVGFVILDDGGIVIEALERAKIAIAQNVLGVIGHLNSQVSIEASKKYFSAKIPQISPASTHPKFTERPDYRGYVYRTIGTDRQLGEAAANMVLNNSNYKRVAVLYNDKPYGVSVSSEFVRRLAPDKSREVVFYEAIPVRTEDHSFTARKVAKAQPDLIFFVGEYNDAGYLLKDLREQLDNGFQFLAAEGVHNQSFIEIAGNAAEGSLILGAPLPSQEIILNYQKRFKKDLAGYASTSYKATKIMLQAMKAAKFENGEMVAKQLLQEKVFDLNGDLVDPSFTLYKVSGKTFISVN
ncbi:MAG: branched-chain amino acid ABC transporter substrate-binding protein [Candidatus Caenarcaniphilales bacterium]|nr:branched-chain amino acid ABC transporter substrate-binding protein [Candidatus Caenarcaniphilales bacterium]